MAIAGAMTTAYKLTPSKGTRPNVERTTYPSDRCTPPFAAVHLLRNWTDDSTLVIVQGSDMSAFWQLWEGGE